jgi:hypothetical protein
LNEVSYPEDIEKVESRLKCWYQRPLLE